MNVDQDLYVSPPHQRVHGKRRLQENSLQGQVSKNSLGVSPTDAKERQSPHRRKPCMCPPKRKFGGSKLLLAGSAMLGACCKMLGRCSDTLENCCENLGNSFQILSGWHEMLGVLHRMLGVWLRMILDVWLRCWLLEFRPSTPALPLQEEGPTKADKKDTSSLEAAEDHLLLLFWIEMGSQTLLVTG